MATKLVGLEIGTSMVRAAEVEISGRSSTGALNGTILKYAEAPMPQGAVVEGDVHDGQATSAAIKRLWSQGGFSTKDVSVGVGNARIVVREMELPELPLSDLRNSLPFQVEEFLPTAAAESLLDFYPTAGIDGDRTRTLRGILVAAGKHSVANTVMAVESAGLKLKVVDLKAFAMARTLLPGQWNQGTVALVDIGARLTTIVVAADGMPRLVRMLPSGSLDVTMAIATAAQLPQPEAEDIKRRFGIASVGEAGSPQVQDALRSTTKALIDGIRSTLLYYSGNNPDGVIQHAVLVGGGAMMPGLGQALASACRLPVSFGNGAGALKVSKKAQAAIQGRESLIAVPVGLATAEVTS